MPGVGIGIDAIITLPSVGGATIRVAGTGVTPVATPLSGGQSGGDLPAIWFDPGNYDAPGAVSVALRVNGSPTGLGTVFQPTDAVSIVVQDDAGTPPLAFVIDGAVAYPVPTLTGALVDQVFILGSGATTYDASVGFAGSDLSYALLAAPAGVQIDAATGIVDISGAGLVAGATVTVQAETPDAQTIADSFLLDVIQSEIVATLTPAMSPLYAGQAVQDVVDFATMTAVSNFTSTGGDIQSVSVSVQGAASEAVEVSEDDLVGFSVEVTDVAGHVQTFVASPVTVQYAARIVTSVGNEADIDINPLVPDAQTLSLTFSGTAYDGTYTPTAGEIRNGLHNFLGTAAITFAGSVDDLVAGDTLTADPGIWSSPTDQVVTYTYAWRRDGLAISGATGASYDLAVEDIGTAITLVVTGDDGVETPVAITTASIGVPGGTTGEAPTYIASGYADGTDLVAIDLSGAVAGDHYYLIVHAITQGSEANRILSVEVEGAATALGAMSDINSRAQAGVARYTADGSETVSTQVRIITSTAASTVFVSVHKANGWAAPEYQAASGTGLTNISVGLTTDAQGAVLAGAADSGRGTAPSVAAPLVGLDLISSTADSNVQMQAAADLAPPDGAYTASFTQSLGTQMALAAVALR